MIIYGIRPCRCFWLRNSFSAREIIKSNSIDTRINFAYDPTVQTIRSPRQSLSGIDRFQCSKLLTLSFRGVHNITIFILVFFFFFCLCGWLHCFRLSIKVICICGGVSGLLGFFSLIYIYSIYSEFCPCACISAHTRTHIDTYIHFDRTNGAFTIAFTYSSTIQLPTTSSNQPARKQIIQYGGFTEKSKMIPTNLLTSRSSMIDFQLLYSIPTSSYSPPLPPSDLPDGSTAMHLCFLGYVASRLLRTPLLPRTNLRQEKATGGRTDADSARSLSSPLD